MNTANIQAQLAKVNKAFNHREAPEENGARATLAQGKSLQCITYGAPGTGKSFSTNAETKGKLTFRTTFHPDSDYSTFVGAYKPTMVNGEIGYSFVAQAFVNAYIEAWKKFGAAKTVAVPAEMRTPCGVDKAMIDAAKDIIERKGPGAEVDRNEIIDCAMTKGDYKRESLIPSDYCYNRVNGARDKLQVALFEYMQRGKYKCLGENYDITCDIYCYSKEIEDDVLIGKCENGQRKIFTKSSEGDGAVEPVFLVIEEINRGNCAQIFGDLFQLLDRNDAGYSDYPIEADADLARYIHGELKNCGLGSEFDDIIGIDDGTGKIKMKLQLPPNLYIRATMNTSDQSLFPIDSAFKRRWDWKYVPISKPDDVEFKILCKLGGENNEEKRFKWWDFLEIVNAAILKATKSEDKQLGYFFVKVPNDPGEIPAEKFAGKVLFYLYNDVFKDYNYPDAVFAKKAAAGAQKVKFAFKDFFDGKGKVQDAVVAEFLENLGLTAEVPPTPAL